MNAQPQIKSPVIYCPACSARTSLRMNAKAPRSEWYIRPHRKPNSDQNCWGGKHETLDSVKLRLALGRFLGIKGPGPGEGSGVRVGDRVYSHNEVKARMLNSDPILGKVEM